MSRIPLLVAVALAALTGCGTRPLGSGLLDGGPLVLDGGQADGGSRTDGGPSTDAGPGADAGPAADGGAGGDGGPGADGGPATDGGGSVDGGPLQDGGNPGTLDADLVGVEVLPRALPGQAFTARVTLRNSGSATWVTEGFSLRSLSEPADLWGPTALPVPGSVSPGATQTFALNLTAPAWPGRHLLRLRMQAPAGPFGAMVEQAIEVTCDDGVFCNGVERFSAGGCVDGPPPCDDGAECTVDHCEEAGRRCSYERAASGCAACRACTGSCTGKSCGDDGCGESCGTCGSGLACEGGSCTVPTGPGSCADPLPIDPVGEQYLAGDTAQGVHVHTPTCAVGSTAREQIYTFTLTEPTVVDARVVGFDTVLSLRTDCADPGSTVACNDDADPPGWPGSRIARALEAGTYFLHVDGYNADAVGPFSLSISFLPGTCVPQCDGRHCGPDGCGGSCGSCIRGECGSDGQCVDACARECDGKSCGMTSCGLPCGTCHEGEVCDRAGRCVPGRACDHFRPTCEPGCPAGQYCGTDCRCRPVGEALPDLTVDAARLRDGAYFDRRSFDSTDCAVMEGCVGGTGGRDLLRFPVHTANMGQADLHFGSPSANPSFFEWSTCHRHFHFRGFAEYELQDATGAVVVRGRKQAFCMEDIERVVDSPQVSCAARYTCFDQGIQRGWSDVYRARLDCQWLDITGVPPGDYLLVVRVNPERAIQELTLDNNVASVPITIP